MIEKLNYYAEKLEYMAKAFNAVLIGFRAVIDNWPIDKKAPNTDTESGKISEG